MDSSTQTPLVLDVKVLDRERVIFSGEAASLSSINEQGLFDVLEKHANFITLIQEKLVIRLPSGDVREVPLEKGIMKVNQDQVTVFVGMELGEVSDEKSS